MSGIEKTGPARTNIRTRSGYPPRPVLHIGSIDTLITSRKSPILEIIIRFSSDFPEVKIKMITTSSAEIDQCVADRRMQVGFSTDRGIIKGARSLPLFSEHSYLYCGKHHPLFGGEENEVTLEVLNQQRFAQHAYSEAELRDQTRIGLTPAASGQFSEGIAMLILTGNFICFLPQHYALNRVESGEMRPLMPANIRKVAKIRLLYHDDGVVMPLVAVFVKRPSSSGRKNIPSRATLFAGIETLQLSCGCHRWPCCTSAGDGI